jgi:NitT/TauT family transport system ATP-binding protein
MVTHDLHEGFRLGTRLLVFDKVRRDPHDPQAFGATITYDLPIGKTDSDLLDAIETNVNKTARNQAA